MSIMSLADKLPKSDKKLRIGFIHPDLGIGVFNGQPSTAADDETGGAERLVVDAAIALQELGHDVTLFTSRHDPSRCFEETRDGTWQVRGVVASWCTHYSRWSRMFSKATVLFYHENLTVSRYTQSASSRFFPPSIIVWSIPDPLLYSQTATLDLPPSTLHRTPRTKRNADFASIPPTGLRRIHR